MLRTLRSYLAREVLPRRRSIARSSQLWIAIVAGAASWLWGDKLGVAHTSISDVTTAVLAYAALAFGFCLAGLTIALTLPDERFARSLATVRHPKDPTLADGRPRSAYSDLIFVFSWTASAHWAVIVWAIGVLAACGGHLQLMPTHANVGDKAAAAGLAFLLSYALMQFMVTVITLSQVGNRYIDSLRRRDQDERDARSRGC